MKHLTHIFFDLDHTLWDYDFNSKKVLREIYDQFDLEEQLQTTFDGFLSVFYKINAALWNRFNMGEIHRDRIRNDRFDQVVRHCGGTDNGLGKQLSDYFLYHCPRQTRIMEDADVALNYLQKRYDLSIVTNGFDDVQSVKLRFSKLDKYFPNVFTSETTGHKKPAPEIFHHAMGVLGVQNHQVLMIGDNSCIDILGS